MTDHALPFTGERFTPECVREMWHEHWHRYAFALPLARDKRVLDAACGEGYGSDLLCREASSVLGVDISDESIEHARRRYGSRNNLSFQAADVSRLDDLPDQSFDLIISFETLEHLQAQEAMLAGFARLLAPDGLLLISTPDRRTYSDLTGYRNEHHVRELYRDEFESLLGAHFPLHRLYGQKLLFQGALWRLDDSAGSAAAVTLDAAGAPIDGLAYAPLYYIAACAFEAKALDTLPTLHLFGDADESVYRHYQDEIRKGIAAGHRLIELDQQIDVLKRENAALRDRIGEKDDRC